MGTGKEEEMSASPALPKSKELIIFLLLWLRSIHERIEEPYMRAKDV